MLPLLLSKNIGDLSGLSIKISIYFSYISLCGCNSKAFNSFTPQREQLSVEERKPVWTISYFLCHACHLKRVSRSISKSLVQAVSSYALHAVSVSVCVCVCLCVSAPVQGSTIQKTTVKSIMKNPSLCSPLHIIRCVAYMHVELLFNSSMNK